MRGRTRRGAGSIGLCWVLAVAVAGCTEAAADPPPESPTATAETSPSPTPTPTPTPVAPETVEPERPTAMDTVDVDGAAAVARYFLELYPYVYATGDLEEWKALSHPECIFCASVSSDVETQVAAGISSTGGDVTVESADVVQLDADYFTVRLVASQAPTTDVSGDGATVGSTDGGRSLLTIIVWRQADAWVVRGIEIEDPPEQ